MAGTLHDQVFCSHACWCLVVKHLYEEWILMRVSAVAQDCCQIAQQHREIRHATCPEMFYSALTSSDCTAV